MKTSPWSTKPTITFTKFTFVDSLHKNDLSLFPSFYLLIPNISENFLLQNDLFGPKTEWKTHSKLFFKQSPQLNDIARNFQEWIFMRLTKYKCHASITIFIFNVLSHHFQVGWTLTMARKKSFFLLTWFQNARVEWKKNLI